ncbi:hypothetical protein NEIG_02313 [Nematocida sp. ERTm5]|nr:hypothetical protein NEIRO02_0356 [Nematocida sp. AWRm79]KAI5182749.1 hypothetical protein NEIRO03_0400 [Nematocida sp. AWRm78]OAG32478.1 hypothetical protein NEIG_02313 [Nematocida sp. ERTm5]
MKTESNENGKESTEFSQFLCKVRSINENIEEAGRVYMEYTTSNDYLISTGAEYTELVEEQTKITEKFNSEIFMITQEIENLLENSKHSLTDQKQQHIEGLTERTNRIIKAFSAEKLKRLNKEHERLKNQYLISHPTMNNEELEEITNTQGNGLIKFSNNSGIEESLQKNKNITRLLNDIKELDILSKQLQTILTITGSKLKSINSNTYISIKNTEGTNRIIERMISRKKRNRKYKIISILLLLIIGLFITGYVLKFFKLFK